MISATGPGPHWPQGKGVVAPPDLPPALAALDLHRQLADPHQDLPLAIDGQLNAAHEPAPAPPTLVLVLGGPLRAGVVVQQPPPPLVHRHQLCE